MIQPQDFPARCLSVDEKVEFIHRSFKEGTFEYQLRSEVQNYIKTSRKGLWKRAIKEQGLCTRLSVAIAGFRDSGVLRKRKWYVDRGLEIPFPTSRKTDNFTIKYLPKRFIVEIYNYFYDQLEAYKNYLAWSDVVQSCKDSVFLKHMTLRYYTSSRGHNILQATVPPKLINGEYLGGRALVDIKLPDRFSRGEVTITKSPVGGYINPHCSNTGRGGRPCFGGHEYVIQQCLEDKDIEGVLVTINKFLENSDVGDAWGSNIRNYPKVTKVFEEEETDKIIASSTAFNQGRKDAELLGYDFISYGDRLRYYYCGGAYYSKKYYMLPYGGRQTRPIKITRELESLDNTTLYVVAVSKDCTEELFRHGVPGVIGKLEDFK